MKNIIQIIFSNPLIYTYLRRLFAGSQRESKNYIEKVLKDFKCQTVLDLCCGTGDFVLVKKGMKYHGIDNNKEYIEFARKRYSENSNIKFELNNVLPFESNKKYDAVLLISTIHHFSDNDLRLLVNVVKRATRKVVVVADIIPDPPSLIGKLLVKLDNGGFIRKKENKLDFFKDNFIIHETCTVRSRFAYQFCIVAIPKMRNNVGKGSNI